MLRYSRNVAVDLKSTQTREVHFICFEQEMSHDELHRNMIKMNFLHAGLSIMLAVLKSLDSCDYILDKGLPIIEPIYFLGNALEIPEINRFFSSHEPKDRHCPFIVHRLHWDIEAQAPDRNVFPSNAWFAVVTK